MLNPSLPLQIPSGTGQLKSNQATKPDNDKNAGQKMEELVGGCDHVSKRLKVLKEALEKFSVYEVTDPPLFFQCSSHLFSVSYPHCIRGFCSMSQRHLELSWLLRLEDAFQVTSSDTAK